MEVESYEQKVSAIKEKRWVGVREMSKGLLDEFLRTRARSNQWWVRHTDTTLPTTFPNTNHNHTLRDAHLGQNTPDRCISGQKEEVWKQRRKHQQLWLLADEQAPICGNRTNEINFLSHYSALTISQDSVAGKYIIKHTRSFCWEYFEKKHTIEVFVGNIFEKKAEVYVTN